MRGEYRGGEINRAPRWSSGDSGGLLLAQSHKLGRLQEVILESAAVLTSLAGTLELAAGLFGAAGRAAFAALCVRDFSAPSAAADFFSSLVFPPPPPPPNLPAFRSVEG